MNTACQPPRRQRGFALIAALVFLLILTVIGVATLNTTGSQDKMNSAAADYNRALLAADSAVTEGEAWLSKQTTLPVADQSCTAGCTPLVWSADYPLSQLSKGLFRWQDFDWVNFGRNFSIEYNSDGSTPPRSTSGTPNNTTLLRAGTPFYVIESLGPNRDCTLLTSTSYGARQGCRYHYRVTARGNGSLAALGLSGLGSTAYAQSVYVQPFN